MAKPEWVIPRSWVICIALACVVYDIVAICVGGIIAYWPQGEINIDDLLFEMLLLWLVLCTGAGVLALALKRPCRPNARCWPLVAVPLVLGLWVGLRFAWHMRDWIWRSRLAPLPLEARLMVITGTVLLTIGPAAIMWFQAKLWRRLRRTDLCIECGYDLTGNTSGRCPECGRLLDVSPSKRFMVSTRWFPELNLFETVDRRNEAWQWARRRLVREPRTWLYLTPWFAFIVLGCFYNWEYLYQWPWWWPAWLFAGIMGLIGSWGQHRLIRRLLRLKLIESGIPVCLRCGRDLRDATAEPCRTCRQKQPPKEDTQTG